MSGPVLLDQELQQHAIQEAADDVILPVTTPPQPQLSDTEDATIQDGLKIILRALTNALYQLLQSIGSGWRYSVAGIRTLWDQHGRPGQQRLRDAVSQAWKHRWTRQELQHKVRIVWDRLVIKIWAWWDYWLCHRCVIWLHERTGISVERLVFVSGVLTFGLLVFLMVRLLVWPKKQKHRKTTMFQGKRRKERSLSLTHVSGNVRGLRDRGFSLDMNNLSAGVGPISSVNNKISNAGNNPTSTRSRGFSYDFWNWKNTDNATTTSDGSTEFGGMRDRHNSIGNLSAFDSERATERDETVNQALQHGISATALDDKHGNKYNMCAQRQIDYYGPTETKLLYSTFTPPPSWTEASRSLLPTDTKLRLQREIALDLSKDECLMSIREPTASPKHALTLPVAQCSIHVKTPVIGGVLQVYVKESSKDEWMEHTFDTAKNAAQFQNDMLAIQCFGPALHRMYQSLELIHQGSIACDGREYVCHHDQMSSEVPQGIGVAWDDAMRALGSNIPSLRVALERFWWNHYSMTSLRLQARKRARKQQQRKTSTVASPTRTPLNNGETGAIVGSSEGEAKVDNKDATQKKHQNEYIHLNKEYVRKRLLIGPVDFFRLFVPCLPETALPRNDSTKKRMEQLLRWRKRTATAALLVQGYVKARIVVNHGWNLHRSLPTHYLTRRLSYDDNLQNTHRDANAKNEVYEGSVSRDVMCFVRPNVPNAFKSEERWWNWRPKRLRTAVSKYQAYTLVGQHVFKIPPDEEFPLNPQNDPVRTFGSLKEMVEAHPDVDFLVASFFTEITNTAFVSVFARTLPCGIDPAFDRNVSVFLLTRQLLIRSWVVIAQLLCAVITVQMSRFKHGSKVIRDTKLNFMMQIGNVSEHKTYTEASTVSALKYLMKTMADGVDASSPNSDLGPSDRMPFPMIPACRLGETRHFGGALQEDRNMPQNYVSFTVNVDAAKSRYNLISKLLITVLEQGLLAKNVFDVTYVLAAQEQDELPERAACTFRAVRVESRDIALPSIYVYGSHRLALRRRRSTQDANFFQSTLQMLPMKNILSSDSIESDNDDDTTTNIQVKRSQDFTLAGTRARANGTGASVLDSFRTCAIPSDDPIEKSVNELIEILENVKIPVRRDQLSQYDFSTSVPMGLLDAFHSTNDGVLHDKDLLSMSLLLLITRGEIRRHFIASGCNLKKAAMRIVETAAWRGQTFPIDRRICRIELQSGQFFQQGIDKEGRPVFYIRNLGLGPWRKDADATVASVLHRLEGALHEFSGRKEDIQCTVIILMGKPFKEFLKFKSGDAGSMAGDDSGDDDGASQLSVSVRDGMAFTPDGPIVANPRINSEESWQNHTNKKIARQLIDLLSAHYPERLHQALVVVKPSHAGPIRKAFGRFTLSSFVESPVTRSKIKLLSRFTELQNYVSKNELVTIAGGEQPIDPEVFGLYNPLC